MVRRETITNELRFKILKRDNFTCQYCGRKAPNVELQIDHIRPYCQGGDNRESNLITACSDCNLGKCAMRIEILESKKDKEELDKRYREMYEERKNKYNYFTNYINKCFKNAGIKSSRKIISVFSDINFKEQCDFDDFKNILKKEPIDEVWNMILDCVHKKITYNDYFRYYTKERKEIIKRFNDESRPGGRLTWQIEYGMKGQWFDCRRDGCGKYYGIVEYFSAKYYDIKNNDYPKIEDEELNYCAKALYEISQIITNESGNCEMYFDMIDDYFEKSKEKFSFSEVVQMICDEIKERYRNES